MAAIFSRLQCMNSTLYGVAFQMFWSKFTYVEVCLAIGDCYFPFRYEVRNVTLLNGIENMFACKKIESGTYHTFFHLSTFWISRELHHLNRI